jgi:hypothetical protein
MTSKFHQETFEIDCSTLIFPNHEENYSKLAYQLRKYVVEDKENIQPYDNNIITLKQSSLINKQMSHH